jgi:hypothetical protein
MTGFLRIRHFLRKNGVLWLFPICLTVPTSLVAQSSGTGLANSAFFSAQRGFLNHIRSVPADSNIINRLSLFITTEADSIRQAILNDPALAEADKIKGIYSLVYFAEGLRENIKKQKSDVYDIPGAIGSYKSLLNVLLHGGNYSALLRPLSHQRTQLLANSFYKFKEHPRLKDIALYKRVASAPEHILSFVETNPSFRFTDSLLLFAAANDPARMASYIQKSKSGLKLIIRNKTNPYLRQIVLLSEHPNVADLLPFIAPLAEGKIRAEEIMETRLDVNQYFQLLINSLIAYNRDPNSGDMDFRTAIWRGVKDKAMSFYVKQINEMHNDPEAVRFASLKGLRPEALYYIMTSSETELYTSSYLGLYKRLMDYCKKNSTDSLFSFVKYDRFREFMRMAANYNTLSDFYGCLPNETAVELTQRYIGNLETDAYAGLGKAMDVADAFTALASNKEFSDLIKNQLRSNFERCQKGQEYLGVRLYNILLYVHALQDSTGRKQKFDIGNYETIKVKSLEDRNGQIVQQVLFYGDEDGMASFNNFTRLFSDSLQWNILDNEHWVTIQSKTQQPLIIYANKPLDHETEQDLRAQEALGSYLRKNAIQPVVLIHRGHSYHLQNTLKTLQPEVKLAILGSCGGYNNILSVASISPNAHIIVSKKIGTKLINDPMIEVINQCLLKKEELVWTEIWEELGNRFKKDAFTLNLFSEYIPPAKNLSLFVFKVFNFTMPAEL